MTHIIIKSFNRPYYLDRCLQSVYKFVNGDFKIIVLDDGTPEKYLNKIKEKFPNIEIRLSEQYDYKVNAIRENLENGKEIDGFQIPTKLWYDAVKEASDYVLVTEDDVWFTQAIDLDEYKSAMKKFDLHLLKLGWLGKQELDLTKFKALKSNDKILLQKLDDVFISNAWIMDLIFENKFKIYSLLYRLGWHKKMKLKKYWQLNSIMMGLWKKEYWLYVWKDVDQRIDEKVQLKNAAVWVHRHQPKKIIASTAKNFLRTTFQSSATNSYHKYGYNFDVNYFNHLMNEAWYEGSFDAMKNSPNDFKLIYFEQFLDKNIDKKEFHLWVENFKNQYRKSGYLID